MRNGKFAKLFWTKEYNDKGLTAFELRLKIVKAGTKDVVKGVL